MTVFCSASASQDARHPSGSLSAFRHRSPGHRRFRRLPWDCGSRSEDHPAKVILCYSATGHWGTKHGTIERGPNRDGTRHDDRRSQMAIGAIDRILKMIRDGKSNNRELTNARMELDNWGTRLLKAVSQRLKPTA